MPDTAYIHLSPYCTRPFAASAAALILYRVLLPPLVDSVTVTGSLQFLPAPSTLR